MSLGGKDLRSRFGGRIVRHMDRFDVASSRSGYGSSPWGSSWLVRVSETYPVTTAVVQITRSHYAFGQVAALFDDYRAHYGRLPSPLVTRGWLDAAPARVCSPGSAAHSAIVVKQRAPATTAHTARPKITVSRWCTPPRRRISHHGQHPQ
jgi:hypothetical protein